MNKPASQSSSYYSGNYPASRAVDGVTTGIDPDYSHTTNSYEPWWEVDLGRLANIDNIKIFNRTDCCSDRLTNFHIFISETPFTSNTVAGIQSQPGVIDIHNTGQAGLLSDKAINGRGRYVRIQLEGIGILSLAEVQVFGVFIQTFATTYTGVMRIESQSLSIEEDLKDLIHIFPNPVENQLHIQPRGDVAVHNYQIFDIIGSVMLSQRLEDDLSGKITLDVNNFPAGIYFLLCNMQKEDGESVRTSYKFVKN